MPVHLFGRPAPLAELAELGVPMIEDAAQAFGSPAIATTGIASTFSFYPTKNLFWLGDGGLVAANDDELGERVRMLRFHGSQAKKTFEYVGYNSRLDELQAACLRIFLPHLDEWTRAAREAADRYRGARARRDRRDARRRARPRLPPLRLPLARSATRSSDALSEQRDRVRELLPDAAAPPAGAAYLGYRERLASRDRASGARELLRPALGGDRRGDAGAGRRTSCAPPWRVRVIPITATVCGSWRPTRLLVAAAWYLAFQLRFDRGVPLLRPTLFESDPDRSSRSSSLSSSRWASTTAGGATSRRATCGPRGVVVASRRCSRSRRLLRLPRSSRCGCRERSPSSTSLLLLAFVAGSRLLAPPDDRAPEGAGSSRAARRCWSSAPATRAS